jgi:hypothetical protein
VHASTVGRALRGVAHPVAVSPVDRAEAVAEVLDLGIGACQIFCGSSGQLYPFRYIDWLRC